VPGDPDGGGVDEGRKEEGEQELGIDGRDGDARQRGGGQPDREERSEGGALSPRARASKGPVTTRISATN
jgi:hypothetical protein